MPFTIATRMMNAVARTMNAVNGMLGRHEVRLIGVRSIAAWGPHFTRENSGGATSCEGVSP